MGENSSISWTDHTFNPWIGCMKVGPACDGCYAEALMGMTGRYKRVEWGAPGKGVGTRIRTVPSNWAKPLKWDRDAAALEATWFAPEGPPAGGMGQPYLYRTFVFCSSLADVFDNQVPTEWRRDLFDLIRATPHLTWLLLTKRPQMIERLFREAMFDLPDGGSGHCWPRNAAIGCTVVNQAEADRDLPILLKAKGALEPAFAFLSMEPLLGPVDLSEHLYGRAAPCAECPRDSDCGCGFYSRGACDGEAALDWVITGGETDQGGHKARPQHPDWFRSLRDQCARAGVAFHHKQNGEWVSVSEVEGPQTAFYEFEDGACVRRVGAVRAGRTIDGELHDARPEVRT